MAVVSLFVSQIRFISQPELAHASMKEALLDDTKKSSKDFFGKFSRQRLCANAGNVDKNNSCWWQGADEGVEQIRASAPDKKQATSDESKRSEDHASAGQPI